MNDRFRKSKKLQDLIILFNNISKFSEEPKYQLFLALTIYSNQSKRNFKNKYLKEMRKKNIVFLLLCLFASFSWHLPNDNKSFLNLIVALMG